jgi:hypothetical protein
LENKLFALRKEGGKDMEIVSNGECRAEFTEEEQEILKKSEQILDEARIKVFEEGSGTEVEDELQYFLEDTSNSLRRIIEGRY